MTHWADREGQNVWVTHLWTHPRLSQPPLPHYTFLHSPVGWPLVPDTSCVVKSSMARSLPVENLLPQNVGSIINYLQQCTEAAHWGTPSCCQPQPATDNGVRDGRSNWLVAPPPSWAVPPELFMHSINQCTISGNRTCNHSMQGNHLAYAATQGIMLWYIMLWCIIMLWCLLWVLVYGRHYTRAILWVMYWWEPPVHRYHVIYGSVI